MMRLTSFLACCSFLWLELQPSMAGYNTKSKRHLHDGQLQPFDNHHIPYSISTTNLKKLYDGQPVIINERSGSSGRGIVIQDIEAPPEVCMNKIRDLTNYPKYVSKVKKVDVYDQTRFENGTINTGAEFSIGLFFVTFGYYLRFTYEPKYFTLTWTLDYQYSSDLDDNTGHWQVMPHPRKAGWSRVLYSTEVKLFSWIPEIVISYLTKTALVEATNWVKKESEKEAASAAVVSSSELAVFLDSLNLCYSEDGEQGATYTTDCAEGNTPAISTPEPEPEPQLHSESVPEDEAVAIEQQSVLEEGEEEKAVEIASNETQIEKEIPDETCTATVASVEEALPEGSSLSEVVAEVIEVAANTEVGSEQVETEVISLEETVEVNSEQVKVVEEETQLHSDAAVATEPLEQSTVEEQQPALEGENTAEIVDETSSDSGASVEEALPEGSSLESLPEVAAEEIAEVIEVAASTEVGSEQVETEVISIEETVEVNSEQVKVVEEETQLHSDAKIATEPLEQSTVEEHQSVLEEEEGKTAEVLDETSSDTGASVEEALPEGSSLESLPEVAAEETAEVIEVAASTEVGSEQVETEVISIEETVEVNPEQVKVVEEETQLHSDAAVATEPLEQSTVEEQQPALEEEHTAEIVDETSSDTGASVEEALPEGSSLESLPEVAAEETAEVIEAAASTEVGSEQVETEVISIDEIEQKEIREEVHEETKEVFSEEHKEVQNESVVAVEWDGEVDEATGYSEEAALEEDTKGEVVIEEPEE